eukprot:6434787-Prymnesium_polylepis.1
MAHRAVVTTLPSGCHAQRACLLRMFEFDHRVEEGCLLPSNSDDIGKLLNRDETLFDVALRLTP